MNARDTRDRITVDLRGAGRLVHERATAQGMTVAAFARRALLARADEPTEPMEPPDRAPQSEERGVVKVTIRLPISHALVLATRARRADVSQGSYLAGLIDGTPLATSPDRREALAALARSTDQLAIVCADLNAFMRLLRIGSKEQLEPYRARIASLITDVHGHLGVAGRFLADVSKPIAPKSGRSRTNGYAAGARR